MTSITVDIVIPALNEAENLPLLLRSLQKQELRAGDEITNVFVVDNGSTDETVTIARENGASVILHPFGTIAEMRNAGAQCSEAKIIVFCDADNILKRDVIRNVINLLGNSPFAALGPDGLVPYGEASWVQQTWYYHTAVLKNAGKIVDVNNLSSGFLAVKASAFRAIGGFNRNLAIGEDSDLSRRMRTKGYRLARTNQIIVENIGHPRKINDFVRREIWHGDSLPYLLSQKSIDRLSIYLFVNVMFWANLLMTVIFLPPPTYIAISFMLPWFAPFIKAYSRVRRLNKRLGQLTIIYFLYALSRSLALFKNS